MEKILISSCFLGQPVRYDGQSKPLALSAIEQWKSEGRLINICPEMAGGLPVPRPPAEMDRKTNRVMTCDGEDVTGAFKKGANLALELCQRHQIKFALLKESSPSCGSNLIYDGTFSQNKINGMGVTAALLEQHGVSVFSEQNIDQLIALIDNGK